MTAYARRVPERDVGLMPVVERPHVVEQDGIAPFVHLVMRGRNQQQRLRVHRKRLTAAVGPLEQVQQLVHTVHVRVGVALVPHANRQQRQHVHEVVIEQHCQRRGAHRFLTAPVYQVVQHVYRNRVVVDPIGNAVPVVHDVKADLTRLAIELLDGAREVELALIDGPNVRSHRFAQPQQGLTQGLGPGRLGDDIAAMRSVEQLGEVGANNLE